MVLITMLLHHRPGTHAREHLQPQAECVIISRPSCLVLYYSGFYLVMQYFITVKQFRINVHNE